MLRRALFSPPVLISLIVVLLAATLPLYVSGYVLGLLTIAYYFGVFSMAWDLLFGFANEVNFGPSFLIGLGAYTAGILDNLYQPPIALCVAAGVLAAMIGGLVLALPALRVRGPYFGLTTLVAVLMLQNFVVVAAGLTGGEIGLTIPDVISIDDKVNYWIALGFMAVSGAILYGLTRSPVGLILQASGQDPVQAGALGFNVTKHKLAAFLVSAFFSGLAGALMAFYLGTASVGTFIDVTVGRAGDHRRRAWRTAHHPRRRAGGGVSGRARRELKAARRSRHLHRLGGRARSSFSSSRPGCSAWSRARGRRHERRRGKARGQRPAEAVRRPHGGQGRQLLGSRRRDSRAHRTEWIGQVDGDEVDPRRRAARCGIGSDRCP